MEGIPLSEDSVHRIRRTAASDCNPAKGISNVAWRPSSSRDEAGSPLDDAPSLSSQSSFIQRTKLLKKTTMPGTPVKENTPVSDSKAGPDPPVKAAPKLYRLLPLDFNKLPLAAGADFHNHMRFAPKPAPPIPEAGVSIWEDWHDPYMGAECIMGFGEQNKPFPWLNGGSVAEVPKWLEEEQVFIREDSKEIQDKGTEGTLAENKGQPLGILAPIMPPAYGAWSHLPEDLDEFDLFDRDIGSIILKIEDCMQLFVSAVLDYLKENLPSLMNSYSFDPRTGQPGPHIDIMRLIRLVNDNESVRREVGKDVAALTCHMIRYVAAWDWVLKLRREIYALEVHQVNIVRKRQKMKAHPGKYTETDRKLNVWRQMESCRELDDGLRHLSSAEDGVAKCAKALDDCKNKVYPRPWDVLQAYDKWIVERDMDLTSGPFVWRSLKDQTIDDRGDPVDRFLQGLPISGQPATPESLSDMCLEPDVGDFDTIF